MKKAIVLSGGGSKGSYQIGVWRAIRKLNIKYNIVTGTSVGALNAALMTQKSYKKALKIWKNLNYKMIFNEDIDETYLNQRYAHAVLHGGMDTTNLENTIKKNISVRKIYKSKINLGIITFDLKRFKPKIIKKEEINKEKLVDYLLASASCFPVFKTKKIDDSSYIDGGIYDNLPINLAVSLGAKDLIVVDLKEVGLKRTIKEKNINITYITPKNDIGNFLIFNKETAIRNIKLGYNDTLKVYKKLDGNMYSFKKNNLNKYINCKKNTYFEYVNFILKKGNTIFLKKISYNSLFLNSSDEMKIDNMIFTIEKLGFIFKLDETKIYTIKGYNKKLLNEFKKYSLETIPTNKLDNIQAKLSDKNRIKFIYDNLDKKNIYKYIILFPEDYLCAVYLKIINKDNF